MNTKLLGLLALGGLAYVYYSGKNKKEEVFTTGGGTGIPFMNGEQQPFIINPPQPFDLTPLFVEEEQPTSAFPLYTNAEQQYTNPQLQYLAGKLNEKIGSSIYEAKGDEIIIHNVKGKGKYTAQSILEKSALNFIGWEGGYSRKGGGIGYSTYTPTYKHKSQKHKTSSSVSLSTSTHKITAKEVVNKTQAISKISKQIYHAKKILNITSAMLSRKHYKEEKKKLNLTLPSGKTIGGS